jgi:hypothetical protein
LFSFKTGDQALVLKAFRNFAKKSLHRNATPEKTKTLIPKGNIAKIFLFRQSSLLKSHLFWKGLFVGSRYARQGDVMETKVVRNKLRRVILTILILASALLAGNSLLAVQSVTLAWNPSTDPNVTGYNVYYGVASGVYTNKIDVGNVTNATINGLVEGVTYYFAATAYNILGVESDFSNETSYSVPLNGGNQPPTLNVIANLTISEDAPQQTVNLAGITSGGEVQTLTVTASSSNPTLIPNPTVNYTSANTTGSLTFTPVANANGSAIVTVTVNDNAGSNNVFSRTFTVTVNAVNDQPTLNGLGNLTINEDASAQTVNLSGIGTGAANETQTLTVTATSSNPSLIPNPTVSYTSPNTTGSLSLRPVTNGFGTATITVTVNDGGSANNTVVRTFTVTVNPVNDPPTLSAIGNLAINAGAGLQTVNLAGVGTGAANETQTLTITASSSNPGLIPNPTVNYTSPNATGTLTFTPVAGMNGSSTVTVTVNDGGSSNNIATRTFTVTVNSAPTISPIANQTISVNSNTGPISFTVADAENPAGSLAVSATSSSTTLIPTNNVVFGGSGGNRTVTLTPLAGKFGIANITIFVSDGTSSASTTFQLNVLDQPTPPSTLTVTTNGVGAITSSAKNGSMIQGKTYSVTAVPGAGQEFAGWTGSINSSSPKLSFVGNSNMVLHANFVPSPFLPIMGQFNGLFYENSEVKLGSSGFFTMTVANHGAYSGRLQIGQVRYAFSGQLNLQCQASNVIALPGGLATLNLQFATNGTDEVSGQLNGGTWIASLRGDRALFNVKNNPAPFAGSYTMVIPGDDGSGSAPEGHGYGTVLIDGNGKARFAGSLADGTKVVQSVAISKNGLWPLYLSLYSGGGSALSWITFTNRSNDDLNGALSWIKLATPLAKLYPAGFTNEYNVVGSTFVTPIGSNVVNSATAQVSFEGGNLPSDFANLINLDLISKVTNTSSNQLTMAISVKNGVFKGKVTDPTSGGSFSFGGAVLEKQHAGFGYLLGTSLTSKVELTTP